MPSHFPLTLPCSPFALPPLTDDNNFSRDGYIVAKVRRGEVPGLTSVYKEVEGNRLGVTGFNACGGTRAVVFDVPQGRKVYYLTDIQYAPDGQRLSVRYRQDMAAAANYLRTAYPQVHGEMERLAFEQLPSLKACTGNTVTIPIYIGR